MTSPTLSITGKRWQYHPPLASTARIHATQGTPHRIVAASLARQGYNETNYHLALTPNYQRDRHDPFLLRDMRKAVARIQQAITNHEMVLLISDFDVDGVTASLVTNTGLQAAGVKAFQLGARIPDRFTEGYGLSEKILREAKAQGYQVAITLDIGINSHREATLAKELGIDLIICDHHLPDGEDVPADAFAVLCPRGSTGINYPNKDLAACGVALKFAEALLQTHPTRHKIIASLLKIAALGTVADMVSLTGLENRAIVANGLAALSENCTNLGLLALLNISGVTGALKASDVGFKLGPRLNAAGRLAHANEALHLFYAKTPAEAQQAARRLDDLNIERKELQERLTQTILASLDQRSLPPVLVFAGAQPLYHQGVLGIVCTRISQETNRPVFIGSINSAGLIHGSARGVPGFHVVEAMRSTGDLLIKCGGHPAAGGFTLAQEHLDEFRARLHRYAEALPPSLPYPELWIDDQLDLRELNERLLTELAQLEPHGMGNPAPLFALNNLMLESLRVMKEKHLRLVLTDGTQTITALWWNAAQYSKAIEAASLLHLAGQPEINEWAGRRSLQFNITDVMVQ